MSSNNKIRQQIVLAALLHDIGKFWERADKKYDESDVIKSEFPNKEFSHTVPTYETSNPKYSHALWTQAFFHKFKISENFDFDGEGDRNTANLAARHHKPSNILEGIISLADKLSSSIDRPDEGEDDESHYDIVKNAWGPGFQKKVPLENIFDVINREDNNYDSHGLSLSKLDVLNGRSLFANQTKPSHRASLQEDYKNLWGEFVEEIGKLKKRCKTFDSFYVSLNDILRNYTWCMPSATNVIPANVSLYEHSKTTAAIAISLYDYFNETKKEILDPKSLQNTIGDEDNLLMVCVDLSGIQKFIYDIANKKAAKSLKGRSFYLGLLMQHIVDTIIEHKDINVFSTNVIYASGGKAYILLPHINKVKNALTVIEQDIQEYLFKEYHGKIFACIGRVAFNYRSFRDPNGKFNNEVRSNDINQRERSSLNQNNDNELDLGSLWRIVSDRASQKKSQKYKVSLIDKFDKFFKVEFYQPDSEKCDVTGERSKDLKSIGNEYRVLPNVRDQISLGDSLKDGKFLIRYKDGRKGLNVDIKIQKDYYEIKDIDRLFSLNSSLFGQATVSSFNFNFSNSELNNIGIKTIFYGGNNQPEIENRFKTFEELAISTSGVSTKLAILRMDVDNLGQVFIKGFNEKVQKKSFAAYSTLSFMLEAFFCGYINQIHQRVNDYKNHVQILYSGGDDLFAVGRWDAIINFAAEVREEFTKYVNRDDITISAGVAIVGAKYPIMKAAELAKEAEEKAKSFNNKSKNAINLFGESVSWDKEFNFIRNMKISLLNNKINSSFLHRMQEYKISKDKYDNGKLNFPSYKWNSAYYIAKILDNRMESSMELFFKDVKLNLFLGHSDFSSERYLDLLAISCKWAEFEKK